MSLKLFAGQLLALVGLGAATSATSTRPTTEALPAAPTQFTPKFPIPNWNGTIPKGASLYRYKYDYNGNRGTIETLARNAINAESKARKRLEAHYGPITSGFTLDLVGKAKG